MYPERNDAKIKSGYPILRKKIVFYGD